MPPKGKLSRDEVQLAVDKIVRKYDEYAIKYFKSPVLKLAFEERYFSALKGGLDMGSFLQAEIEVAEELHRKAEAAQQQTQTTRAKPTDGFADRVMEELRARTAKYEDVVFHRQASVEIRRLVGALSRFDRDYLTRFHDALRDTSYSFSSREMVDLDSRLRDLTSPGPKTAPPRLTRYVALLAAFPRDYNAVDREEKSFLVDAAYLLHDLRTVIERVGDSYQDLGEDDKKILREIDAYLIGVLDDFRLKDFRRPSV
jgi:hypothetical protein